MVNSMRLLSVIGQLGWPKLFEDLPEAIKAHLARARAAKPTGVERIADCELRDSNSEIQNSLDLAGLPKAGTVSRGNLS